MLKITEFFELLRRRATTPAGVLCIGTSGENLGKFFIKTPLGSGMASALVSIDGESKTIINFKDNFLAIPEDKEELILHLFKINIFEQNLSGIKFIHSDVQMALETYVILPLLLVDKRDSSLLLPHSTEIISILTELFYFSTSTTFTNGLSLFKVIYSYGLKIEKIVNDCMKVHTDFGEAYEEPNIIDSNNFKLGK